MTRLLPALHEGHAPINLHMGFSEAVEAFGNWDEYALEPCVEIGGVPVPISSVFGRMRTCTDLLPARIADDVEEILEADLRTDELPALYADAARAMRALCVQKIRNSVSSA
ncbi:MAG: hypothetical protein QM744_10465 [Mesorhizobium sp.]